MIKNKKNYRIQPEIPSRSYMSVMYGNMCSRCYRESYQRNNPRYKGCSVCDEWLQDKEAFYRWVLENWYTIEGEQIDLDKDILVKGNKVYSPETCIFVPHIINIYFEYLTKKPVYVPEINKWQIDLFLKNIGLFDTEEDAKKAYIKHKEAAILDLALKYKGKIPDKLYEVMVNYKIELSDWKDEDEKESKRDE